MNINFSTKSNMGSLNYPFNTNLSKKSTINDKNSKKPILMNRGMNKTSFKSNSKKNALLKNLMKQKSNLLNSKNSIMERGLKNSNDPLTIKEKLQSIDKQIKDIDKQINDIQLEEQRNSMGIENKDKNKKKQNSQKNLDVSLGKDMKANDPTNNLLSLSSNLSKAKSLSSQKTLMSGTARVLACEIKIDEMRGLDPVNKKKLLDKIKNGVESIDKKLSTNLKEINKTNSKNINSSTIINKNQEKISNHKKSKENSKEVIVKQRALQSIKHYKDSLPDKTKNIKEQVNFTA